MRALTYGHVACHTPCDLLGRGAQQPDFTAGGDESIRRFPAALMAMQKIHDIARYGMGQCESAAIPDVQSSLCYQPCHLLGCGVQQLDLAAWGCEIVEYALLVCPLLAGAQAGDTDVGLHGKMPWGRGGAFKHQSQGQIGLNQFSSCYDWKRISPASKGPPESQPSISSLKLLGSIARMLTW